MPNDEWNVPDQMKQLREMQKCPNCKDSPPHLYDDLRPRAHTFLNTDTGRFDTWWPCERHNTHGYL